MKSIIKISIVFLLALYICPAFFAPSYRHTAIPTDENKAKDFTPASEYTVSDQSITSFEETLPDDVLFSPDSFRNGTHAVDFNHTTADPSWTYEETFVLDGDKWLLTADPGEYGLLEFEVANNLDGYITANVHAQYFGVGGLTGHVQIWNFTDESWVNFGTLIRYTYDTFTYSTVSADFQNGTSVLLRLYADPGNGDSMGLWWDWGNVAFDYMLLNGSQFAESFADVSEWETPSSGTTGAAMTSDGDLATITENGPFSLGVAYVEFASIDYFEYYYEFRIDSMTASICYLMFWDDLVLLNYIEIMSFSSAGTYKGIISDSDADSTRRIGFIIDSNNDDIVVDYLRISPTNETGWQHDGSVMDGITDYSGTVTSDGDLISVIGNGEAGAAIFWFDVTPTKSKSESNYYPFVSLNVTNTDAEWSLGYATTDTPSGWGDFYWWFNDRDYIGTETVRLNLDAGSYDISNIAILSQYGTMKIDWVKFYSIANYTITQSGTSTDDILYVDSETLYCSGTSFTSITLDHDPVLSVATTIESLWELTVGSGVPQSDYYVDSSWAGYSSETSGFLEFGSLIDVRVKFTAPADIGAITFRIRSPEWIEHAEIPFYFPVKWSDEIQFGYDAFFIFLGLIMIPLSTMYLVRGGRKGMNADKFFFGIVIFAIGIGFLIGGILP